MSVHLSKRRILSGGFAAAAVLTLVSPAPGSAAAAQAAAMTATPSTGLTDGAVVAVAATGLQPGTTYTLGQCGLAGDVFACDTTNLVPVSPAADGSATTSIVVRTSFQGTVGPDGEPGPLVDCTVIECGLGMFNEAGDNAGAPISFA